MKQEFMLSYSCNEIKRRQSFSFRYGFAESNQYHFMYQRDSIILDSQTFNDLVAISKQATRSFTLDIIPFQHIEGFKINNEYVSLKLRKPIEFFPDTIFVSDEDLLNIQNNFFLKNLAHPYSTVRMEIPAIYNNDARKPFRPYENISLRDIYKHKNADFYEFSTSTKKSYYDSFYLYEEWLSDFNSLQVLSNFLIKRYNNYNLNSYEILTPKQKYKNILNIYEYADLHRDIINYFTLQDLLRIYKNPWADLSLYSLDLGSKYHNILNVPLEEFGQKENNGTLNLYSKFVNNVQSANKYMFLYGLDNTSKSDYSNILNLFTSDSGSTGDKTLNLFSVDFGKSHYQYLNLFNETDMGMPKDKEVFIQYFIDNASTDNLKGLFVETFDNFADILYKHLFSNNIDSVRKFFAGNMYYQHTNDFCTKDFYEIYSSSSEEFANKYSHDLLTIKNEFTSNTYKNLFVTYGEILSSSYKKTLIDDNFSWTIYYQKQLTDYKSINGLDKSKNSFKVDNVLESLDKNKFGIVLFNKYIAGLSSNRKVTYNRFEGFYDKKNQELDYFDTVSFLDKTYKKGLVDKVIHWGLKQKKSVQIDSNTGVSILKQTFPFFIFDNSNTSIISVEKESYRTFTNDLFKAIIKINKPTWVEDSSASVIKIPGNLSTKQYLGLEKILKDANFIKYMEISVIKNQIKTDFYNNDIFVDKNVIDIFLDNLGFLKKYSLPINIASQEWLTNNPKETMLNTQEVLTKTSKNVMLNGLDAISEVIKPASLFWQEVIEKDEKHAWIHKGFFIDLSSKLADRFSMEVIFKDEKLLEYFNKLDTYDIAKEVFLNQDIYMDETIHHLFYANKLEEMNIEKTLNLYNNFQITRTNDSSALELFESPIEINRYLLLNTYPSLQDLIKTYKDLAQSTVDSDWAWVYEEDDKSDDPFSIDELLLPEHDTRYEDFEDIIFNRETGKPRNTVKIVGKNEFIAKYPIKYPMKDKNGENAYQNVAIEYLDVRTNIMKKVFMAYYTIWQDHIFEFSRMTIQQSSVKILDYLYTWILMEFSAEDLPEALRTFRLVRWFIESSMIQDSEYHVTYTPDNLTSGRLDTTTMDIPNDLDTNNTMYIDTTNHVVRNNMDEIMNPDGAHLTIYIDNEFNTRISFSLHSQTPVDIILNGDTIDHLPMSSMQKLVYNIPYTERTNEFTIKRTKVNNTDGLFFIGDIVIDGMGKSGELDIAYEPTIQGNKVLNHASQKVLAYLNMYLDNQAIIDKVVKNNIYLSDTYEKLKYYWDHHHEHKIKGKRLTIKRT